MKFLFILTFEKKSFFSTNTVLIHVLFLGNVFMFSLPSSLWDTTFKKYRVVDRSFEKTAILTII